MSSRFIELGRSLGVTTHIYRSRAKENLHAVHKDNPPGPFTEVQKFVNTLDIHEIGERRRLSVDLIVGGEEQSYSCYTNALKKT